jgi:HAD superfamily hydrolase (TIGR01509 family)
MSGKLFLPRLLRDVRRKTTPALVRELEAHHTRLFRRVIPSLGPLNGSNALLDKLRKLKISWAIASTGQRQQTEALLQQLGTKIDVPVLTGDDVAEAKPSPDVFQLAAARLKVAPSECFVIGDSVWDLLAAQRMRAAGVGVLTGGYGREELERAGAYRVYQDPADLLANLDQLGIHTDSD